MDAISKARFEAYRAETFRLGRGGKLRNEDDAVQFVNERGFVYFWPNKGVDMPTLWGAVAATGRWRTNTMIQAT